MIAGVLPTLFGEPVPPDQQKRVDEYTRQIIDKLEQAGLAAVADLKPSHLAFGIGKVGFSINRRTKGGPVDHDLPVMSIVAPNGKIRGIYVNYACHCVVLSDYKVSGDWAGAAAEELEKRYPGSVALVSIGCGADSNPACGVTGDKAQFTLDYARQIADEVDRLFHTKLADIHGNIECQLEPITLQLHPLPSRQEWMERAKIKGPEGYYAKVQLARLDAGQKLPTEITYPVQTWKFGDSLAAVFLSGEVVVDYSLRLKKEFDATRLWINAYSNDAPAYIPSERVLKEGGYEGGGAMIYYGLPAPFAAGLEDEIVAAVHSQLGDQFTTNRKTSGTQGSQSKSPAESLAAIQMRPGLRVELVAAEPQIKSPVSIDFGPDGKVWVAQMADYGCKDGETCPPAGRITVLEDRDHDGTFETATVFLDKIAQPFAVTVWRKGVLISAAPDLLYAEDTDGDGKADVVQKIFTGFSVENPQARLNTLAYALDGWLEAGTMRWKSPQSERRGNRRSESTTSACNQIKARSTSKTAAPKTAAFATIGATGSAATTACSACTIRFPIIICGETRTSFRPSSPSMSLLAPRPHGSCRAAKSCCFPCLARADRPPLLVAWRFIAMSCSVRSLRTTSSRANRSINSSIECYSSQTGPLSSRGEPPDEADSEFLSSTDNWFRPVQARTGPDGALWIVDMYRYVIEHSRWIPKPTLDELDLYAGSTKGRIYRVLPQDAPHRPLPRLDQLDTAQLVAAMDSPNGPQRDMVQQLLTWRHATTAAQPLAGLARNSNRPAVRLQALCTLALLEKLPTELIETALADPHPAVKRQAIRLAETRLASSPQLLDSLLKLADESDPFVALQLACSLGETDDPRKIDALATIAQKHADDPYVVTAIMSSLKDGDVGPLLNQVFARRQTQMSSTLAKSLMELAGAASDQDTLSIAIHLAAADLESKKPSRFTTVEALLAGFHRNSHSKDVIDSNSLNLLQQIANECMRIAKDDHADVKTRVVCLHIIGGTPQSTNENISTLAEFLSPDRDSQLQLAAIDALSEQSQPAVADHLLSAWRSLTPTLRVRALDVLISRKQWVAALLAAIQAQTVLATEIDAAHQARLTDYPDPELSKKARASFAQTSAERVAVVARYQPTLKNGDAQRGQAIFQKNCTPCHKFDGIGNEVGPNIAARQDKSNDGLLREILDPNRAVDQHYAAYTAVTNDGIIKNGILLEETSNAITLLGQQGEKTKLLRSQLDSLTTSGKSLMPEGFEKQITPQEMADLIKFLASP